MSLYLSDIDLSIHLFIFMTSWPYEMVLLRVFIMGIITDTLQYSPLISRVASSNTLNNFTTFSAKAIVENETL